MACNHTSPFDLLAPAGISFFGAESIEKVQSRSEIRFDLTFHRIVYIPVYVNYNIDIFRVNIIGQL